MKVDLNEKYGDVQYTLKGEVVAPDESEQNNLNLVIIGHVDSGKSTLTGKILVECGEVSHQVVANNVKKTEQYGKASF